MRNHNEQNQIITITDHAMEDHVALGQLYMLLVNPL